MTYLNQWSGWGLIFPSIIAQFFFCCGPHSQRVARHEDCPLKSWCTGRTSASPGPWTKLTLDIREMPPKSWGTSWLV